MKFRSFICQYVNVSEASGICCEKHKTDIYTCPADMTAEYVDNPEYKDALHIGN